MYFPVRICACVCVRANQDENGSVQACIDKAVSSTIRAPVVIRHE